MFKLTLIVFLTAVISALVSACSPKFDWRDVRDGISPFTILMPDKPAKLSREIQMGQEKITMNMTAAQIDHVNFAVGAAKLTDAAQTEAMLATIKNALLLNLAGRMIHEKNSVANIDGKITLTDDFDAVSAKQDPSGSHTRMTGKLVGRDGWVFQVLVVGPENEINNEAAETFLSSFKPV